MQISVETHVLDDGKNVDLVGSRVAVRVVETVTVVLQGNQESSAAPYHSFGRRNEIEWDSEEVGKK